MYVLVEQEHKSNYPDPIEFDHGDELILGEQDKEYEGWIRVKTHANKEGWAPLQFIKFLPGDEIGLAKCRYSARELNTVIGEKLRVLKELNEWYQAANKNNEIGWVPISTVKKCIKITVLNGR